MERKQTIKSVLDKSEDELKADIVQSLKNKVQINEVANQGTNPINLGTKSGSSSSSGTKVITGNGAGGKFNVVDPNTGIFTPKK